MTKRVVAFIGNPAAGKTSHVNYLEKEHGFYPVRPSSTIHDFALENLGVEIAGDRLASAEANRRIVAERGPNWKTDEIFEADAELIAMDGLRVMRDLLVLNAAHMRDKIRFAPVALVATPEDRYAHLKDPEGYDKPIPPDLDSFLSVETPEYLSREGVDGIAVQTVIDNLLPFQRVEYTDEPLAVVRQEVMSRLAVGSFLDDPIY